MEKKKLLLVAVSVGVVLLIVISIPLLLISPGRTTSLAAAAPVDFYPSPELYVQPEIARPVFTPLAENAFAQPEETPVENPNVTTITIPAPHTAAVPDVQVTPAPRNVAARPAPAKPAPATPAPEKPAAAIKPAAKPAPAAETSKSNNNYWVQTGAFSTQVRAEGAKESLASKGITSIIDNRDINGKTWYRVRVGPYISEKEASYWLALVKSIDGFGDSQIRQTP